MSERLLEALRATVCFTVDDAERAYELWGANCGPTALAAVLSRTLDEVRPHLGDFESKRYTNPTLMLDSLRRLGVTWRKADGDWPVLGLVRIQWEGPWTAPGVPMRVRYRHTHWIAASTSALGIVNVFDINALCVGGWISVEEWRDKLVPWLLKQCEPKADGRWHATHRLELKDGLP